MRIAILSNHSRSYGTKRLKAAAKARGHNVRVLNTFSFSVSVAQSSPELTIDGKSQRKFDAVIPRIGASATVYGTAVVRQFEQMGIFVLNSSHGISTARDKLRAFQVLSRHQVGMPPSVYVNRASDVLPAIELVGGAPVIIKLLQGTQGVGVILAESTKSAEAIVETLHLAQQHVLIQKFIAESKGRDIRAFVVGDRVVAAMRRTAQGDEFRSNVHRGGLTEGITLDSNYAETAVRAAKIIGLSVAGVDILESNEGPQIMEVNASPGLEGIEAATGIDVASKIIEHLEEQVVFPYIDFGERLSLSQGYTLLEISVTKSSPFNGRSIKESLDGRDIQLLCLIRGNKAIPNPDGHEVLNAGDDLILFGDKLALKEVLPRRLNRLKV